MSALSELYQEILLEHNSKPRNFRKVEDASSTAEGYNPSLRRPDHPLREGRR